MYVYSVSAQDMPSDEDRIKEAVSDAECEFDYLCQTLEKLQRMGMTDDAVSAAEEVRDYVTEVTQRLAEKVSEQ